MANLHIRESGLIKDVTNAFLNDYTANIPPEDVYMLENRFMEAFVRFLAQYKSKDMRVAIILNDISPDHDFIMGLCADYIPPEDESEEMPGNWTVVASFNEDDILNTEKNIMKYDLQTDLFDQVVRMLLAKDARVRFESHELFVQTVTELFSTTAKHLMSVAKGSTEDYSVNCGLFTISAGKNAETGEIETAIELGEDLKKIIKDDAALETITLD